jgi:hypothetical protein
MKLTERKLQSIIKEEVKKSRRRKRLISESYDGEEDINIAGRKISRLIYAIDTIETGYARIQSIAKADAYDRGPTKGDRAFKIEESLTGETFFPTFDGKNEKIVKSKNSDIYKALGNLPLEIEISAVAMYDSESLRISPSVMITDNRFKSSEFMGFLFNIHGRRSHSVTKFQDKISNVYESAASKYEQYPNILSYDTSDREQIHSWIENKTDIPVIVVFSDESLLLPSQPENEIRSKMRGVGVEFSLEKHVV